MFEVPITGIVQGTPDKLTQLSAQEKSVTFRAVLA
jgi:hypothetical protein